MMAILPIAGINCSWLNKNVVIIFMRCDWQTQTSHIFPGFCILHPSEEETLSQLLSSPNYSCWYNPIPDLGTINNPLAYIIPPVKHSSIQGKGPPVTAVMPCVTGKFGCSINDVRFICCIQIIDPVDRLNLHSAKEDCYFAEKEFDWMTENEDQCMIYCWYATHIYLICGKKKCFQLSHCLWEGCFQSLVEITVALVFHTSCLYFLW